MSTGGGTGFSPESVQPEPDNQGALLRKIKEAIAHSTQSKSQRHIEGGGSHVTYRPQEGASYLRENTEHPIPEAQQHAAPKDTYRYETRPLPQPDDKQAPGVAEAFGGGLLKRGSGAGLKGSRGARGRASTDVAMESPAAQAMREMRSEMTDDTPKMRRSLDPSVPGIGQ